MWQGKTKVGCCRNVILTVVGEEGYMDPNRKEIVYGVQ